MTATERSGPFARLRARVDGWTPELRQTVRTLVSVLVSDLVARGLHLHEPFWALITAVIVTQARISATFETGRDQILGTLVGAVFGAAGIALALTGLPKMPLFALLMVPLAILAAFKPNLRLAGVTLVVVFLFPAQGSPFSRPIDRVLAILTGAAVSLAVSYLVFHSRARQLAFQAAADMVATVDQTQREILTHPFSMADVERLNDASSEALKSVNAAILEARRERLTSAIERHEPLLVRLVPMLRRLQSDVLFVARARDGSPEPDDVPQPVLQPVSEALGTAFEALRQALEQEANQHVHDTEQPRLGAEGLASAVGRLGDEAGPLLRFTLQMLSRDVSDMATALATEVAD